MSKSSRDELALKLASVSPNHPLKSKDLKIAEGDDPSLSIVFDENEKIYLCAIKKGKDDVFYFPSLKDSWILPSRPTVTVDSGAVKFVVNGANVMRPGITKIDGHFASGDIVVVNEEKYGKAIAVGLAKMSESEMQSAKKGQAVETLHYVGDKFWDMLKEVP